MSGPSQDYTPKIADLPPPSEETVEPRNAGLGPKRDAPLMPSALGIAQPERAVWWGQYTLPSHRQARWRLGPTTVWLQHLAYEWRLASHTLADEGYDKTVHTSLPTAVEAVPQYAQIERYCFAHMCDTVRLVPALPDRPVVSKPDTPLAVFPGEQITIYLSFPLWLRVEVGDPPRLLREIPVYRLSDTWFGPNTREGELCYASRTAGTVHLADLVRRPYRAQSAVVVRNQGLEPLLLERINVNLPSLSLWVTPDGTLWTNALLVEKVEGSGMATLHVDPRPPSEARDSKFLAGPRVVEHRSAFARAFSSILSSNS